MKKKVVAVTGCLTSLPDAFPLDMSENSGNMVHANAPLSIFKNAVYLKDKAINTLYSGSSIDFVNNECDKLIVTFANTLRLGEKTNGERYKKTLDFLQKIKIPVVVFGLGVQSNDESLETAILPDSAIQLLQYLSSKASLLGVRGEFTKTVVERLAGVKNVYVTGCPSIYTNPEIINDLRGNLKTNIGVPAFSGTKFFDKHEAAIFENSILNDHWLIEPVNKLHHKFFIDSASRTTKNIELPYHFKYFKETIEISGLKEYFTRRYKCFRNVETWYSFNKELVSYTYGTRFHVNMASIISGKPALWVVHDARTRELTNFMSLPSVEIDHVNDFDFNQPIKFEYYEKFFDNFSSLIKNFNNYLEANGLPNLAM